MAFKPFKDQVMELFPEIARLAGTEMRRSAKRFDDYVEIPGNGFVLRVRWEIERTQGLLVTLYKEVKEEHLVPRELNLGWFVKFKGGSVDEERIVEVGRGAEVIKIVKKYALGYLLGREKDFDNIDELSRREIEEKHHYSQWNKANKWIRPEWPPSN